MAQQTVCLFSVLSLPKNETPKVTGKIFLFLPVEQQHQRLKAAHPERISLAVVVVVVAGIGSVAAREEQMLFLLLLLLHSFPFSFPVSLSFFSSLDRSTVSPDVCVYPNGLVCINSHLSLFFPSASFTSQLCACVWQRLLADG